MSNMGDRKAASKFATFAALSALTFGCAPGASPKQKETLKSVQPVAHAFADVANKFERAFGISRDWAAVVGNGAQILPYGFNAGSAESRAALHRAAADLVQAIETLNGGSLSAPKQAR